MGNSPLLLPYCSTIHLRSLPVITTKINCSAGGKKKPSDNPRKANRVYYNRPKFNSRDNNNKQKKVVELRTAGFGSRTPLSDVVSDCARRWFEDTLREAEAGDVKMQELVGQMYCSGYGVPKDVSKGRAWIDRASESPSPASQLVDKHPGYNSSTDSDSFFFDDCEL